MKVIKQKIYQQVKPELIEVENFRKKLAKKKDRESIIYAIVGVSLMLFIALMSQILQDSRFMIILVVLVVALAIFNFGSRIKNFGRNPGKKLDQQVGQIIMEAAHPDWTYEADSQLSASQMSNTGLSSFVSGLEGSNLTIGKYEDTEFAFSLFKSPVREKEEKSMQTKLVMVFDFHKDIKGHTVVFPDAAQKTLGAWLGKEVQKMGWKGLDLVYFEDPIFEKHFAVYGTDQIEARYILTPNMMQGLVKLREKYDHNFSYSFANGKVCVLISDLYDYRNQLYTPIIPDGAFYHFYRPVEIAMDVIETMNLNTRIWSKD